jgi:hypothetical protein
MIQVKKQLKNILFVILIGVVFTVFASPAFGRISGAIYTSVEDGGSVNANIYESKEDVYLNGGPKSENKTSMALPAGDYYFQVTDPSGKHLLSEDPVSCRRVRVSEEGVFIAAVDEPLCSNPGCVHEIGIDIYRPFLDARTIRLMPYSDTPNNGGVYKVWITPVDEFVGNPCLAKPEQNRDYIFGFVPAFCKTDNYKVSGKCDPPIIDIIKFEDLNTDGIWDEDEPEIDWMVTVTDPLGSSNVYTTPVSIVASKGIWTIAEEIPSGWEQTALFVDGVEQQPPLPEVPFDFKTSCGEVHEVIFGNTRLFDIKVCKFYDKNMNKQKDEGEEWNADLPVITFHLTGTTAGSDSVDLVLTTDEQGKATFEDILSGIYTLCEEDVPADWVATTPACVNINLPEDAGDETEINFGFGNVKKSSIKACKFHDKNMNGRKDEGEDWSIDLPVITFCLEGAALNGDVINTCRDTDENGCVVFGDLLPGNYTLCEENIPTDWVPTTSECNEVDLASGEELEFGFGNVKRGSITACKFYDKNMNKQKDEGEGWSADLPVIKFCLEGVVLNGDVISKTCQDVDENGCVVFDDLLPGDYTVCEENVPDDWKPTTSKCKEVDLASGEELEFGFGNVKICPLSAFKYYDKNQNSQKDMDEPALAGILFILTGEVVDGSQVYKEMCTGADGLAVFADLFPGAYMIKEQLPDGDWEATGPMEAVFTLPEDCDSVFNVGNICYRHFVCGFGTKGYWHNQNGIEELKSDMALYNTAIGYVNSLAPYKTASDYFDQGDEPFNGTFANGAPVPAGQVAGTPAGSREAEISNFLVEDVGNGGIREQLAQQLLAFIFNTYYRAGGLDAKVALPGEGSVKASDIIADAIEAWSSGTTTEQTVMSNLLDRFNNSSIVSCSVISEVPCDFAPMCQ